MSIFARIERCSFTVYDQFIPPLDVTLPRLFLALLTTVVFSYFAEAVKNIVTFMGLHPCERSDKVPEGKSSHTLLLAGVYRGGYDVLVRAKLAFSEGVTMQITVRSNDASASEVIASAVG